MKNNFYNIFMLLSTLCFIQASTANVLPADRRSTSALGEVLSSLVSATCWPERKRGCRKDVGRAGRHLHGGRMNCNFINC